MIAIAQQLVNAHPEAGHIEVQESYVPSEGHKGTKFHLVRACSVFMFFVFGIIFGVFLMAMIIGAWDGIPDSPSHFI